MLTDIERKVLTIIRNNVIRRRKAPNIQELMIRTGSDRAGLYNALKSLAEQKYIEWNQEKPNEIRLLRAWEWVRV